MEGFINSFLQRKRQGFARGMLTAIAKNCMTTTSRVSAWGTLRKSKKHQDSYYMPNLWEAEKAAEAAELSACWFTFGKGPQTKEATARGFTLGIALEADPRLGALIAAYLQAPEVQRAALAATAAAFNPDAKGDMAEQLLTAKADNEKEKAAELAALKERIAELEDQLSVASASTVQPAKPAKDSRKASTQAGAGKPPPVPPSRAAASPGALPLGAPDPQSSSHDREKARAKLVRVVSPLGTNELPPRVEATPPSSQVETHPKESDASPRLQAPRSVHPKHTARTRKLTK